MSALGPVHTPLEKFDNGGFTLKTHQMFCVHTTLKEFKTSEENSVTEITWLSRHQRFWEVAFSKCFPSIQQRKGSVFKCLQFEERFRKAPFSQSSVFGMRRFRKALFSESSVFGKLRSRKALFSESSVFGMFRFRNAPFSESSVLGKSSVFGKLRFRSSVFGKLRFRDRLVWTVSQFKP